MNPILNEIIQSGKTLDKSGKLIIIHSNVGADIGKMLQRWVLEVDCKNAVEIGLAFGISSLYILESLSKMHDAKLYGIDPMQNNELWQGIGKLNIERAGYSNHYIFHEQPSYLALPELLKKDLRVEFAFIDGWHTFDYVLLDFFFIDKILEVGGVIGFDDVGYKSIRKAISFVLTNLNYEIVDSVRHTGSKAKSIKSNLKHYAQRITHPITKNDWSLNQIDSQNWEKLEGIQTVMLRKTADDSRRWDHFTPF